MLQKIRIFIAVGFAVFIGVVCLFGVDKDSDLGHFLFRRSTAEIPVPVFPKNYHASGVLHLPHSKISEPFEIWFSGDLNLSRIDYYYGTDQTYQRVDLGKNGILFKVVPMYTDKKGAYEGCWHLNGSSHWPIVVQSIIPRMSDFKFEMHEVFRGTRTTKWEFRYLTYGMMNSYTFWVSEKKPHRPVCYQMRGYDSLLASYYDSYLVNYVSFEEWVPDMKKFELPEELPCHQWSHSIESRLLANPMQEFMSFGEVPVDELYNEFTTKHNKTYPSTHKHAKRKRKHIFRHNMRYIRSINRKNLNFRLAPNHLTDLQRSEYDNHEDVEEDFKRTKHLHKGAVNLTEAEEEMAQQKDEIVKHLKPADVPDVLDWRDYGAIGPVRGQGICGACYAIVATEVTEASHFLKTGGFVDLSAQQVLDCSWGSGNHGCRGGFYYKALSWIFMHGIASLKSYGPYLAQEGACHINDTRRGALLDRFAYVPPKNATALKIAVARFGPAAVTINEAPFSVKFYSTGIYDDPTCGETGARHSVLVIGYGEEKGIPYWIIKNSWSKSWGLGGYMKIAIRNNICGITNNPIVGLTNYRVFQLPVKTKMKIGSKAVRGRTIHAKHHKHHRHNMSRPAVTSDDTLTRKEIVVHKNTTAKKVEDNDVMNDVMAKNDATGNEATNDVTNDDIMNNGVRITNINDNDVTSNDDLNDDIMNSNISNIHDTRIVTSPNYATVQQSYVTPGYDARVVEYQNTYSAPSSLHRLDVEATSEEQVDVMTPQESQITILNRPQDTTTEDNKQFIYKENTESESNARRDEIYKPRYEPDQTIYDLDVVKKNYIGTHAQELAPAVPKYQLSNPAPSFHSQTIDDAPAEMPSDITTDVTQDHTLSDARENVGSMYDYQRSRNDEVSGGVYRPPYSNSYQGFVVPSAAPKTSSESFAEQPEESKEPYIDDVRNEKETKFTGPGEEMNYNYQNKEQYENYYNTNSDQNQEISNNFGNDENNMVDESAGSNSLNKMTDESARSKGLEISDFYQNYDQSIAKYRQRYEEWRQKVLKMSKKPETSTSLEENLNLRPLAEESAGTPSDIYDSETQNNEITDEKSEYQDINQSDGNSLELEEQNSTTDPDQENVQPLSLQQQRLQQLTLLHHSLQQEFLEQRNLQQQPTQQQNSQLQQSLQQPNLQQPNLQQPNLQQPNLQQPNLQQANLQQPNLQQSNLQQSNLQQSNLQQPKLQELTSQQQSLQLQQNLQEQKQKYKVQEKTIPKVQNVEKVIYLPKVSLFHGFGKLDEIYKKLDSVIAKSQRKHSAKRKPTW